MLTIFCDGVFDLFHHGHLNNLKSVKTHFDEPTTLIVGIISDNTSIGYKRKPVFNENMRKKIVSSCKYVDKVIIMDHLIIDEAFMDKYSVDYVFHAFSNNDDLNKQSEFYKTPIELDKFITVPYTDGVSTTTILKESNLEWGDICEKKGMNDTEDLYILNGYDKTNFNPKSQTDRFIETLDIQDNNTILEVGCGAGLIASHLKKYDYTGVDKSLSLVNKHINLLYNTVINFSSTDSIFKDKYFDYCICNSMLEYLNTTTELDKTIDEIERVTKHGVFIGNVRYRSRTTKTEKHIYDGSFTHFIIDRSYFINRGYTVIDSMFEPEERYDVYKKFV
jgi:cytidyltransferase-like protein